MRRTFPKLFYVASPGFGYAGANHDGTWSGISGDRFHGRFASSGLAGVAGVDGMSSTLRARRYTIPSRRSAPSGSTP
ncbi:MAG: hypothetical protein ACK5AZ_03945 [Bryobacteraceae bacterium]